MRGRKARPVELHLASGTYRSDRHAPISRKPAAELPAPPAFLNATARRVWRALVPELAELGVLAKIDADALAVYCQARADFSWAVYRLRRDGRIVPTGTGSTKAHPAIGIQKAAADVIRNFGSEFGLTPSSRTRLRIGAAKDPDDPETSDLD